MPVECGGNAVGGMEAGIFGLSVPTGSLTGARRLSLCSLGISSSGTVGGDTPKGWLYGEYM